MVAQSLTLLGTVTAIPSGLVPSGLTTSANIPVPDNATLFVTARVDTSLHTNQASTLDLSLDLSMDGGQSWTVGYIACSRGGGPGAISNGVPLTQMTTMRQIPDGVGRLVRVNVATSTPLQTGTLVDFSIPSVV